MNLIRDVQKNYRLPGKDQTIGELLAKASQKSGAEKLTGHDIMALERFAPDTRHMIVLDVLSHESPIGYKGDKMRLFLTEQGYQKALDSQDKGFVKIKDHAKVMAGHLHMHQALKLRQPDGINVPIERTVYRVMEEIGISHRPKRKPNGITKSDRESRKSDDLIKRNFKADKPLEKCVTDMTEVKCLDGKLYVSAIFDYFDSAVLGLAMDTSMKATLCEKTLENTYKSHPGIRGCILPSDRRTQYTSERYRLLE